MNKSIISFISIVFLLLAVSCGKDDSDEETESVVMQWEVISNSNPENINVECWNKVQGSLSGSYDHSEIDINANGEAGYVVLHCKNGEFKPFDFTSFSMNLSEAGIEISVLDDHTFRIQFNPYNSVGETTFYGMAEIRSITGEYTKLSLIRTSGREPVDPMPEAVPDKYKFRLAKSALFPFMNIDTRIAAPFDHIVFQIRDYYDRYNVMFQEFTQYYDSIVWCADGFPDTMRVYEYHSDSNSSEEQFTSQWGTYFCRSGQIKNHLKGYRNGEVVHTSSLTVDLVQRDFIGYDWTHGGFAIANPVNNGICCLLDAKHEYTALDTQEINGTLFARVGAWNNRMSHEDFLVFSRESLIRLMRDNVGEPREVDNKVEDFKCLPADGYEAVKFWENKASRILLLHRLSDEDYMIESYYLHVESKL